MIAFEDCKHSLHTWSAACCLQRACSRVDRLWFRERWSDCMAAAAEASTWLFSSSPSSWRTTRDSCAVFKSVSTSCGNTLNKDMNSWHSGGVISPGFKGRMKWLNSSTVRKTCIYYCISISKFPVTFCITWRIKKICQRTCTERNRKKTMLSWLSASLSCWWGNNCWKRPLEFTDMMVLSSGSPHCELIQL